MKSFKEYSTSNNESNSTNMDYEKKFRKKVEEINKIIQKAKDDGILAIETEGTWESVYEFDKVVLTKTKLIAYYKEDYGSKTKSSDISLAKDRQNDFEEANYLFNWIKKPIKKGYRKAAKEETKLVL